jgi:hypothetical protein
MYVPYYIEVRGIMADNQSTRINSRRNGNLRISSNHQRTTTTLGDLPADTVVPDASGRIGTPTKDFDLNRPQKSASTSSIPVESEETSNGVQYPLAKKDRMKASDFAKRLREAETMHAKEADEAKARK